MSDTGGLSTARLGRMHEVMAGYVERGQVPGLVTLVSRRGETHVDAIGALALEGAPVRRDTIFRISSMTKPVVAVAAMILVEECALRLDDPLDRLLPELADRRVLRRPSGPLTQTVPARRPLTLRDLLTFRMGLGQVMAPPDSTPIQQAMSEARLGQGSPAPDTAPAPDEWMRRLGALPLIHQPGGRWMYNTGSDVLGVLIARAAGRPLEAFLRERLFEPLGMTDTGFYAPPEKLDRLATAYATDPATGAITVSDPAEAGQWSRPPAFPSGAGGLVSTVDDYLAFGRMLLNRGAHEGRRILSRPTVELMTSDHLTRLQKRLGELVPGYFDSHGWGFGMATVTRRDDLAHSAGAFGWDGGLGTSWYSDPREDMVTILMTQAAWTSPSPPPVCRDFWACAYQAIDD
jgi:CubicO group peptidase (beta-lactamase class C family)